MDRRAWWVTVHRVEKKSLVGYSSQGRKDWDMTELLSTHTHTPHPYTRVSQMEGASLWSEKRAREVGRKKMQRKNLRPRKQSIHRLGNYEKGCFRDLKQFHLAPEQSVKREKRERKLGKKRLKIWTLSRGKRAPKFKYIKQEKSSQVGIKKLLEIVYKEVKHSKQIGAYPVIPKEAEL